MEGDVDPAMAMLGEILAERDVDPLDLMRVMLWFEPKIAQDKKEKLVAWFKGETRAYLLVGKTGLERSTRVCWYFICL